MRLLAAFCTGKNGGPGSVMGAKASKLLIPPGGLPRYPSRQRPHTSGPGTPGRPGWPCNWACVPGQLTQEGTCAPSCASASKAHVFFHVCHDRTSRGQILAVWVASTGYARLTTWQPLERFGPSHGKSQPGGLAACAVSRAVSRPVSHDMGAPVSLAVVLSVLSPDSSDGKQVGRAAYPHGKAIALCSQCSPLFTA